MKKSNNNNLNNNLFARTEIKKKPSPKNWKKPVVSKKKSKKSK
jgi:hypothetical protein